MRFTLTFEGALPANGGSAAKQTIRRQIHPQLKQLWSLPPLDKHTNTLLSEEQTIRPCVISRLENFRFAPLVSTKLKLIAKLQILFLRPEPPGNLVTQGGDIDNRLKTLFDALRMPRTTDELPLNDMPQEDENPFFCLLEDDSLITEISVSTDMLLAASSQKSSAKLFIRVETAAVEIGWGTNLGLA
jgi:hypothetical protein